MKKVEQEQRVVRDGKFLAIGFGLKLFVFRQANGDVTQHCENIVASLDKNESFTLEGLPDAVAQAIQQVLVHPDEFCDVSEHNPGNDL